MSLKPFYFLISKGDIGIRFTAIEAMVEITSDSSSTSMVEVAATAQVMSTE